VAATAQQQTVSPMASWRVAIIDDVYAGPSREAVKNGLAEFCAEIGADDDLAKTLNQQTQCNFTDANAVSDAGIVALYQCRSQLTNIAEQLEKLFLEFDQRRNEVRTIEENLKAHGFADSNIKTFQSVQDLFSGDPFQLVFLDLLLAKGEAESQDIAKQIYEKFKAFILLMSNSPVVNQQVEGFRRATRLLSGFFEFQAKSNLCDREKFRIQIETLPKDPEVCHAVHNFVIALEQALGGPIDELPLTGVASPPSAPDAILPQFMHTLRALGLHDYALLCELTLRNEGHPLGDYMMRLLGSHLLAQLLSHQGVKDAVAALDALRFTEFLPFGDERSPSFHRMYADGTTEAITGSWKPHPWSIVRQPALNGATATGLAAESGETEDAEASPTEPSATVGEERSVESELLQLLGFQDDDKQLPYVQLGDLFIKDEKSLAFAVLSASCELQFVPTQVHKDRERLRDDTVLLVPGRLRTIGAPQAKKSQTMAGLIEWNGTPYCVDWFDGKLLGLPHCSLRKLLEERGYQHLRRLQTARALELQQAVLSKLSRIGLEVRPPFPRDIRITLFGRKPDQSFGKLGDPVAQGGLLFHGRKPDQRVLVLRRNAFFYFAGEMKKHGEQAAAAAGTDAKLKTGLPVAATAFMTAMGGLKLPIEIPGSAEAKAIQLVDSSGKKQPIKQVAIRFGAFTEPPASTNKDLMFCLSAEEE
jgi:hypothetical protein